MTRDPRARVKKGTSRMRIERERLRQWLRENGRPLIFTPSNCVQCIDNGVLIFTSKGSAVNGRCPEH